jgi:hypothetical protein
MEEERWQLMLQPALKSQRCERGVNDAGEKSELKAQCMDVATPQQDKLEEQKKRSRQEWRKENGFSQVNLARGWGGKAA